MSNQTIHIKSSINRDDLDAVITGLEVACGGIRIQVEEAFDLVVTDKRQAAALEILFGDNSQSSEIVQEVKKSKSQPKRYPPYTFLTGENVGQQISGVLLHFQLNTSELVPGTRLSHPTKGELIVVRDELGQLALQPEPTS